MEKYFGCQNVIEKHQQKNIFTNFSRLISDKLFAADIVFPKSSINIKIQDLSIIMQYHKTLLFYNSESWLKKAEDEEFDVPVGCYDGAKVCKLIC